jgi:pyruvate-ferredoxin/flavodoxin oxidoreductase
MSTETKDKKLEQAMSSDKKRRMVTIDGNTAAAYVAHATNEVIAIYPITPSSNMGEIADAKSAAGETNIWGTIPVVVEMQSEGGASGAVHGAITTGALTTTFTASQGLLLMIPNMFKIAGELTPVVFHVSARAVATHALSIFGDHSDVMATRSTGFGLMASGSVQEVMDLALIAQASSLHSLVPFVHFFDGFRISHEVSKVEEINFDDMKEMLPFEIIKRHRERGLNPEHPVLKGTSQNPDVFFASRETVNKYYLAAPDIVQQQMDKFAKTVGRQYKLFDYFGHPEPDRIVIMMGSASETMHETIDYLNENGEKVGMIKVRLYRPFSVEALAEAIPASVKAIAVLDRTKEAGAVGEPLYTDVQAGIDEAMVNGWNKFKTKPIVVGGRYGLGSAEFNPGMAKGVLDNLKEKNPKNHFTIGIKDDVANTSLDFDYDFDIEGKDVFRGMFYGLGSDGTVGANKNSIKIIGENTDNYAQGYFVYDSKKAGAITVSHVRFGPKQLQRPYLISKANFIACHNFTFLEKINMLEHIVKGGTFLLNSMYGPDEVWNKIPKEVQKQIIDKELDFYVIDGIDLAKQLGLGARINMIMQTAFFAISNILPKDEAVKAIKDAIKKTYGRKGEKVVQMNYDAVDAALKNYHKVDYPKEVTSEISMPPTVPENAPEFVQNVTAEIIRGKGHELPVSAFPYDGAYITGTTQYEKRNIAVDIPVWEPDICIQCNICSIVCPHGVSRAKVYDPKYLKDAPETFKSLEAKGYKNGEVYTLQVAPEDCTGCELCVEVCPAYEKIDGQKTEKKAINMSLQAPLRKQEAENWDFFLSLPETDPSTYKIQTVKGSQFVRPLFEFSGACAGCGETPYVKLLSQLFGDRALMGNATGCSSIYGGNLPTTPFTKRADGRGPAWSNSLFEDAAEFAFGMRLNADKMSEFAAELLKRVAPEMYDEIAGADQSNPVALEKQRERIAALKKKLETMNSEEAKALHSVADYLVKKSVWAVGGDGWAYDIGYGGLDHVMASGRDINVLVLDTEVYSNTGGQMSKATPRGATAQFAAAGRPSPKKDLGMMIMSYGNVYVSQVAMGANHNQTVRAFMEAESYPGPSIIIAYSVCIAHGFNMANGLEEQKKAVKSGHWVLYRYNPALIDQGKNPLQLDSKEPSIPYEEYAYSENRWRTLKASNPERAAALLKLAQRDAERRWNLYSQMAAMDFSTVGNGDK